MTWIIYLNLSQDNLSWIIYLDNLSNLSQVIHWRFEMSRKSQKPNQFFWSKRNLEKMQKNELKWTCFSWNWFSSLLTMSAVYWWPDILLINIFRFILSYHTVFSRKNTVLMERMKWIRLISLNLFEIASIIDALSHPVI